MQPHRFFRPATALLGTALALSLVASPGAARKIERGVESVHQPRIDRTDFVFDLTAGGDGTLDQAQARQLAAWFVALNLRYGDRVTIASPDGGDAGLAPLRNAIREMVERHGLLVGAEAPLTAGTPPGGALRVIVSRSIATVPGCPSWRDRLEADWVGGQSDNYGCAIAGNLAAMVADPNDLITGRRSDSDLTAVTSGRAIKVYNEKVPTGSGGLQVMSAGGK